MRVFALVVLVVLLGASGAWGQVSMEEAQRRLAERQSRRAASRPATTPAGRGGSTADTPVDPNMDRALSEAWGKVLAKQYEEAAAMFSELIVKQPSSASA